MHEEEKKAQSKQKENSNKRSFSLYQMRINQQRRTHAAASVGHKMKPAAGVDRRILDGQIGVGRPNSFCSNNHRVYATGS